MCFGHSVGVCNHIEVSLWGGGVSYFLSSWDTFPLNSGQVFRRKGWWKPELEPQDLGWSPWISVGNQTPQDVFLRGTASRYSTQGSLTVVEMLELSWLLQPETLFVYASSSIQILPVSLLHSQPQTISFYLVFACHLFEQRQHFEACFVVSLPLATWNQLCFNILCLHTFMVLRKGIWVWNKCYEHLKIACCSCTVRDVPCYSAHAPVLRAVLAVGMYLCVDSGSCLYI